MSCSDHLAVCGCAGDSSSVPAPKQPEHGQIPREQQSREEALRLELAQAKEDVKKLQEEVERQREQHHQQQLNQKAEQQLREEALRLEVRKLQEEVERARQTQREAPEERDIASEEKLGPLTISPSIPSPSLPRIAEEELSLEEVVGEGTFSVVWRATWRRAVAVGKQRVNARQVAVKMSNRLPHSNSHKLWLQSLTRDLAVMSELPHQNILTLHGVCESKQQRSVSPMASSFSSSSPSSLMIVYELMTSDLAKLLQTAVGERSSRYDRSQLLPTHVLLRVLRDVSAGLAHLHSHGVIHKDVKPANILLRDEQVKLCDFGSSRDLQHTVQQMSVAGTLDYMAPEVINREAVGKAVDVWSFGVLLYECVVGTVCDRRSTMDELVTALNRGGCLPSLIELFVECHQHEPNKRPLMSAIHTRLQELVMQDARDSQRVKEELKRAEAQDRDIYELTWNDFYANQPHAKELLHECAVTAAKSNSMVVRQPLKQCEGKGSMEELEQLADTGARRLHTWLKTVVEECGGTYLCAVRKSFDRCVQRVAQDYCGDFSKLLDVERATGMFEQAEDMLRCLRTLQGGGNEAETRDGEDEKSQGSVMVHTTASGSPSVLPLFRVVRCKDRLNTPLQSGYRDLLLNVSDVESGFVAELQLNFHKIAQIRSQSHRFYELIRVMDIKF